MWYRIQSPAKIARRSSACGTFRRMNPPPLPPAPTVPRIPLSSLPGRGSPLLTRVLPPAEEPGPGRVAVAAFQSSV